MLFVLWSTFFKKSIQSCVCICICIQPYVCLLKGQLYWNIIRIAHSSSKWPKWFGRIGSHHPKRFRVFPSFHLLPKGMSTRKHFPSPPPIPATPALLSASVDLPTIWGVGSYFLFLYKSDPRVHLQLLLLTLLQSKHLQLSPFFI